MMDQQQQRSCCLCRTFKNPICIAICIFTGAFFSSLVIYTLIGVEQCFLPVDGIAAKTCNDISNELSQACSASKEDTGEHVHVHQHNIALNLSKLRFDSRENWKSRYDGYMFHNATLCRGVIAQHYPHLLSLYDSYPDNIQRADVSRVAILHHYGGIYSDIDNFPRGVCLNLGSCNADVIPTAYFPLGDGNVSVNHFFLTNKNNSFVGYLLDSFQVLNRRWKWIPLPYLRVFLTTGPCAVTIALRNWQKMWLKKGVSPAPDVVSMVHSPCMAQHRTGRQWLSLDGKIINWIGDNPTFFIYRLVAVLILFGVVLVFCLFKRRFGRRSSNAHPRSN